MKNLHRCPKCSGKRIWVIEQFRIPSESDEGRVLPVVQHEEAGGGLLAFRRVAPRGHFDLYLCDACGYSELWADGFRGLSPDPEKGIRLLDTSDATVGPFR